MSLADDLDSAADNLCLSSDKLKWLSRLEEKGKLPERVRKRCQALINFVDKTVTRLVRFADKDIDKSLDDE